MTNPKSTDKPEAKPGLAASAGSAAVDREKWLERCAAHFRTVAALDEATALDMAKSLLEALEDDLTENPEEAAEGDMSYWTAD